MSIRKSIALLAVNLILAAQPAAADNRPDPAALIPMELPQVSGPIPVTAQSRPFLGAQAFMAAGGYVEDEYFLSGSAYSYDWAGSGRGVKVVAGPGQYGTRILVMRPRDAARFGGNVEVTLLNASLNLDFGGPTDFARMVRQGDVWIGITTKAVTANALKKFDAARYAALAAAAASPPAPPKAQ